MLARGRSAVARCPRRRPHEDTHARIALRVLRPSLVSDFEGAGERNVGGDRGAAMVERCDPRRPLAQRLATCSGEVEAGGPFLHDADVADASARKDTEVYDDGALDSLES